MYKYHLLLSGPNSNDINIGDKTISSSKCEKLLGIKIDNELSFNEHIEDLCKKASQKLNALSRLASTTNFQQRRLIMNSFITSHFSYCPVVWMFHSRKLNNRIKRLHERALRTVYKDFNLSFEELLSKDKSVTIHQRNIQKLVTEIFKVKAGLAPEIMKEVFDFVDPPYNLRNNHKFNLRVPNTNRYGIETASYIGPKLWEAVPEECKNSNSLDEFKIKIKKWIPENCPCKICKTYIKHVGYL